MKNATLVLLLALGNLGLCGAAGAQPAGQGEGPAKQGNLSQGNAGSNSGSEASRNLQYPPQNYDAFPRGPDAVRGMRQMQSGAEFVNGVILAVIGLGSAFLLYLAAVRICARLGGTTDPHKLAMSDPWIRAHLKDQQLPSPPTEATPE